MKKTSILLAVVVAAGLAQAQIASLDGSNTVGFALVTNIANQANTIITVPFEACLGNGAAGMVSDLVSTNGLVSAGDAAHADQLVVLTSNVTYGLIYYYYWLQAGTGWTAISTTVLMPGGTNGVVTPPAADSFPISRGLGFWLKRYVSNSPTTVLVKGQVSNALQATEIQPGLNLIGFASPTTVTLNGSGISWSGAYGGGGTNGNTKAMDRIALVGQNGALSNFFYFTMPTAWLSNPTFSQYSVLDGKWIISTSTGYVEAVNVSIPAGHGFWYTRRGTNSFTFQPGL